MSSISPSTWQLCAAASSSWFTCSSIDGIGACCCSSSTPDVTDAISSSSPKSSLVVSDRCCRSSPPGIVRSKWGSLIFMCSASSKIFSNATSSRRDSVSKLDWLLKRSYVNVEYIIILAILPDQNLSLYLQRCCEVIYMQFISFPENETQQVILYYSSQLLSPLEWNTDQNRKLSIAENAFKMLSAKWQPFVKSALD